MNLHFLFGAAGADRSGQLRRRLIRSAEEHPEKRHIILVPEQFTMQTQRNIVADHPRHAVMNIDVLSFERLAHRVFGELGEEPEILTETGKMMLLRRAAGIHRGELGVFGKSLKRPGFVRRLMAMLSEFYQYGITEEELGRMSEGLASDPLLAQKMADLKVLYGALNEISGEAIAAEELLPVLSRRLPGSRFAVDAVIAVDGFTGFTPVQHQILSELIRQAESVTVSMMLPEEADRDDEIRETDLFYLSRITESILRKTAAEAGCPVSREFLPAAGSFLEKKDFCFMSRHFLQYGARETFEEEPEHIRVFVSRDPRAESEWAARMTQYLVREKNLRFREIAVVAGDITAYRPYLVRAFREAGIPIFCDRRKGLMGNALVEYVRSALEVIARDFSYDSVFRHLRCGICRISREDLDELDNYVLASGLRGRKRWQEEWTKDPAPAGNTDLGKINASRQAVVDDLRPLMNLQKNAAIADRTEAVRTMIAASGAEESLTELAQLCREAGDAESATENEEVMDYLGDFLAQTERLLGEETCSAQEFAEILDAGLEEAKLGMIPTGLDQVTVGDVRRSRQTEVRALFVLGMNDGLIPGTVGEGGILTERERGILIRNHLEIAPTAETVAGQDRFYLYTLMTLPKEFLFLSLSRMSMDGTSMRPSYLLGRLQGLFPALSVKETGEEPWQDRVSGAGAAWDTLAETIRGEESEKDPEYRDFVRALAGQEGGEEHFRRIAGSAFRVYRGEKLDSGTAGRLYGDVIAGSVTGLETYAGCPARHFFEGGLRLTERKTAEFTRAGEGSFLHAVLERFFRCLKEEEISPGDLNGAEIHELVERAIQEAASDAPYSLPPDDAGGRYLLGRMGRLAEQTAEILCRQIGKGSFLPAAFELHFDGSRLGSSGTELSGGGRMYLRGTIDRVDVREENGTCSVRVIDYKTGKKTLSLDEICDGISLQLPVYLDTACELWKMKHPDETIVPAGMYYYQVTVPVIEEEKAATEEELQNAMLNQTLLKGMRGADQDEAEDQADVSSRGSIKASGRQFQQLFRHTRRTMRRFGEEIMSGEISAAPVRKSRTRTVCDYCPFRGTCSFDPLVPGYSYRELPKREDREVWEILAEEDSENDGASGEMDSEGDGKGAERIGNGAGKNGKDAERIGKDTERNGERR